MYDVIVIGAGPTGATAAKILTENKLNVLVVERMKLPRYKSCSGMLIKKTIDLVKKYFGEEVPNSVKCTPFDNYGMVFTDDKGKEYVFEQKALNVWRSKFDYWLIEKAIHFGAELRDGTDAISCMDKNDHVDVVLRSNKRYTEQARYVIDCEGMTSLIKRGLCGSPRNYITTFQTFNEGTIDLNPHYFYAYLQPELSEYDAWFNVKDDMLVLGVAVKNPDNIARYYDNFIRYMSERHKLDIKKTIKQERWLLPYIQNEFKIDYGIGCVFFAGEVAGFLNPMGEGISSGIESGCAIAQSIINHFLNTEDILHDYINRTEKLKEYMGRQWQLVSRLVT